MQSTDAHHCLSPLQAEQEELGKGKAAELAAFFKASQLSASQKPSMEAMMAAAMMHAAGVTALPAHLSTGRNLDRNLERVVAEQRKLQELTARDRWAGGVCVGGGGQV